MTLNEYVELTISLVRNQSRLVEECGYCIEWNGNVKYFDSIEDYIEDVKSQLNEWVNDNQMVKNISVEEAMYLYGLG